jgi:hypothetical protein
MKQLRTVVIVSKTKAVWELTTLSNRGLKN